MGGTLTRGEARISNFGHGKGAWGYEALITRDALRAARVKKRVGYLFRGRRRRVFIFLRRSHKW